MVNYKLVNTDDVLVILTSTVIVLEPILKKTLLPIGFCYLYKDYSELVDGAGLHGRIVKLLLFGAFPAFSSNIEIFHDILALLQKSRAINIYEAISKEFQNSAILEPNQNKTLLASGI